MTSDVIVKKKKRRLLLHIANVDEEDIKQTVDAIVKKIFKVFKYCVGKDNGIEVRELFRRIYDVDPDEIDVFKRGYYWNVLKHLLTKLRSEESLFVVNEGTIYYVLHDEKELETFQKRLNVIRKNLDSVEEKAKLWVRKKKWQNVM